MKNNNCRPDSVVYNTVVGVLWNTGVVWAQAKAVQVSALALLQTPVTAYVFPSNTAQALLPIEILLPHLEKVLTWPPCKALHVLPAATTPPLSAVLLLCALRLAVGHSAAVAFAACC